MSELIGGLRGLEVQDRATFHRERAHKELVGVVRDERTARRRVLRLRRAA